MSDKEKEIVPSSNSESIEVINKFIDLQKEEIRLRGEELVIRKQENNNKYDYAKDLWEKQLSDRKDSRKTKLQLFNKIILFGVLLVVLIVALIVFSILTNNTQIALYIISFIIGITGGGGGGYAYGLHRSIPKQEISNDENN